MKYLTVSLAFFMVSSYAAEQPQQCLANTDLNPENRFTHEVIVTNAGDYKVVNDNATGLQWSYCLVGQTYDATNDRCEGEPSVPYDLTAEHYPDIRTATMTSVSEENKRLGSQNHLWHLPDVKQLLSIYNERCVPAIYPAFSYSFGMTTSEIEVLATTRPEYDSPDIEFKNQSVTEFLRGKAYKNYTMSSDTLLKHNSELTYHVVHFSGLQSPTTNGPFFGGIPRGLLRLVREKS